MCSPRLKHPEWVLMYRQGVTVQRIASLNGVSARRVREYVGRVQRQHPHLLAGRLFLHDQPAPRPDRLPDPDRRWRLRLDEYVEFLLGQGRRPVRGSGTRREVDLAHWLTRQRSLARRGRLAGHRARWLDEAVPNWQVSDRSLGSTPQR